MSSYDPFGIPSKPDKDCRTCTDFSVWSKQQRRQIANKTTPGAKPGDDGGTTKRRQDCPLDKSALGNATWSLLHTMAAFYADCPTDSQKKDMKGFFHTLTRVYPCDHCAKDFSKDLQSNPINVNSQKELSEWLCNFHNRVNKKLGKPLFDCSKVNERWRDGWSDGSCEY